MLYGHAHETSREEKLAGIKQLHNAQCHIWLKENDWHWKERRDHAADDRNEVEKKRHKTEQWS